MKKTAIGAAVLGFLLVAGSAFAQTPDVHQERPLPPAFISGGVGEEDRAELEATEKSYSFKLVLVGEGGVFLDDVHVTITDATKQEILVANTEGPILLVQLKPGKYNVRAEVQGLIQNQGVMIRKNRHTNITLRFPLSE